MTARLVNLWSYNTKENLPRNPLSPANFLDFQKMNTTLDGLEGYFTFVTPAQLQTDAGTEITYSLFVTSNMFNMLGRSAALGRAFALGEENGVDRPQRRLLAPPLRRRSEHRRHRR